jgi:hypothetical protein
VWIFRSAVVRRPVRRHDTGIQRPFDQGIGRARGNAGPDDGQEVFSKLQV